MMLHCSFLRELVGEVLQLKQDGNPEGGKHRVQETLGDEGKSWADMKGPQHTWPRWGQQNKGLG